MVNCNESKFALFNDSIEERLSNIEFRQNGIQFSNKI